MRNSSLPFFKVGGSRIYVPRRKAYQGAGNMYNQGTPNIPSDLVRLSPWCAVKTKSKNSSDFSKSGVWRSSLEDSWSRRFSSCRLLLNEASIALQTCLTLMLEVMGRRSNRNQTSKPSDQGFLASLGRCFRPLCPTRSYLDLQPLRPAIVLGIRLFQH